MKILHVIQKRQLRGAETFACQLSVELLKAGDVVDIVSLFENDIAHLNYSLNFISLHANKSRRLADVPAFRRLSNIITNGQYDIVQANSGDTLKYVVFSKWLFRWDSKVVFRNANMISNFMHGPAHRFFNRLLLRSCDYFISVSEKCRKDLISFFPAAVNKSSTIPIGTYDFSGVTPHRLERTLDPIFINISSFVPEKNHAFMVDMFVEYVKRNGKGLLWLVGGGKLLKTVELQVREAGIADRVIFWNYRTDVISILKSADVLVLPSLIEGLPGCILESLSCGKPVIASDVGGISEVIADGVNGFCIKGYNLEDYVTKMEALSDNEALRMKFATGGLQLIGQHYLMPRIAERFRKRYEKLITG